VADIQTCWNLSQKPALSHRQFCVAMSHARNGCNIKFNKQTTSQKPEENIQHTEHGESLKSRSQNPF
jgi:hypothetical protein